MVTSSQIRLVEDRLSATRQLIDAMPQGLHRGVARSLWELIDALTTVVIGLAREPRR